MTGINPNAELQHFYNQLPTECLVSNNIEKGVFEVDKRRAAYFQWIATRPKNYITNIIVDLDNYGKFSSWYDLFQEKNNLAPNLLVVNPNNGKSQGLYRLENPVSTGLTSLLKPQQALKYIRKGLNHELGGDPYFTNRLAKNYLCKNGYYDKSTGIKHDEKFKIFSFRDQPWSFDEFYENIDFDLIPEALKCSNKAKVVAGEGRNQRIFDYVRFEAYKLSETYKQQNDYNGYHKIIVNLCCERNELESPQLSNKEILVIAKSISDFGFYIYQSRKEFVPGRDHQKVQFLTDLRDKQVISAIETNNQRKNATESKIRASIDKLRAMGSKVTQKAISDDSGIHRNTIREYKYLLNK